MRTRWGLGPVFVYEWLTASRRWQMYAVRAGFVGLLFLAVLLVWFNKTDPARARPGRSTATPTPGPARRSSTASSARCCR